MIQEKDKDNKNSKTKEKVPLTSILKRPAEKSVSRGDHPNKRRPVPLVE